MRVFISDRLRYIILSMQKVSQMMSASATRDINPTFPSMNLTLILFYMPPLSAAGAKSSGASANAVIAVSAAMLSVSATSAGDVFCSVRTDTVSPCAADVLVRINIRDKENTTLVINLFIWYVLKDVCGKRGIRTPDTLLTYTRFPGVPLQPLEHLSLICRGNSRYALQNYSFSLYLTHKITSFLCFRVFFFNFYNCNGPHNKGTEVKILHAECMPSVPFKINVI